MSAAVPDGLWLIGCGNMGGAMLRRWVESGAVVPERVFVLNRHERALPAGVRQGRALPDEPPPGLVMLGVKPQQLDTIPAIPSAAGATLISILAGVEADTLAVRFPDHAIVRAMPNLPVALGKGVVALHGARSPAIDALMAPLGLVEWIADEALFDAVTALAGSGPGFVYRFIDSLAEAGAALGLPAEQAQRLALATVEGAGMLAARSGESPAALAEQVASPGGSTRKGLEVLDRHGALKALLRETLAASARRNAEMAAAARG